MAMQKQDSFIIQYKRNQPTQTQHVVESTGGLLAQTTIVPAIDSSSCWSTWQGHWTTPVSQTFGISLNIAPRNKI
jgi:hypothetical protein